MILRSVKLVFAQLRENDDPTSCCNRSILWGRFFFFFLQLVKRSGTSSEILEPYTFLMSLMFSFRLHGLYYDVCSVVSTLSHLTTESYVQIFVSILKSWRKLLWEKAYQCSFSQLRMASNIKVQVVR